MSSEINVHAINDYLCEHPGLSSSEFRVAYFTIHSDYGRKKHGLFWKGAADIADKTGTSRQTVKRTWEKMAKANWLVDTGRKVGRATVWQVQYRRLYEEALEWERLARRKEAVLPDAVLELLRIGREDDATSRPNDALSRTVDCNIRSFEGPPEVTNPPKEASEFNPPNQSPRRDSDESRAETALGGGDQETVLSQLASWRLPAGFKFRDGMGIDDLPYPAFDESWGIEILDYYRTRARWFRNLRKTRSSGRHQLAVR